MLVPGAEGKLKNKQCQIILVEIDYYVPFQIYICI